MIAYENIRTRTLASDSIGKSENDATRANDESFPDILPLSVTLVVYKVPLTSFWKDTGMTSI
jgi:hypothetical protein